MVLKAKCNSQGGNVGNAGKDGIWHCSCQPDRYLAKTLNGYLSDRELRLLAEKLGRPVPTCLADRYDIIYRIIGCKTD